MELSSTAYAREDERDDALFYSRDRFVQHLDGRALATVERVIGALIVEQEPAILDLMASWDSHIPESVRPSRVVGLGLNRRELEANKALTERVFHDLNADPILPFEDGSFDVVLNTVSVDYLTRPVHVFWEAGRVLRPGGLFLVVFSNRYFPPKAVKVWRESSEEERVLLVESYFKSAGVFENSRLFFSRGKPRAAADPYAHLGIPSDPIYALYADRKGLSPRRERPCLTEACDLRAESAAIEERKKAVRATLRCPYCGGALERYEVPQHPFTQWDTDHMYVCFSDACPYYLRSFHTMEGQGNRGLCYRLMYDPTRDVCMAAPVPSLLDRRTAVRG